MAPSESPVMTIASMGLDMMASPMFSHAECNRSICGRCKGKKFDGKHAGGARKCQRCRGQGFTRVGRTKR